jgi:hypothetical protein
METDAVPMGPLLCVAVIDSVPKGPADGFVGANCAR